MYGNHNEFSMYTFIYTLVEYDCDSNREKPFMQLVIFPQANSY